MNSSKKILAAALLTACLVGAGCATTKPVPYTGISSSTYLKANAESKRGHMPYAYSEQVDWRQYSSFVMEPVSVYHGPDSQFVKISEEDKNELADYMQEEFERQLSLRYKQVGRADADSLRVKLILTGAAPTKQMVGTVMKMDLAGAPYNIVQSIRGKEGVMTGSVTYVVEIYDASTDRLLKAFVEKQYPNAMNMKSTFGRLTASKTGIRKGAKQLADALN